MQFKNPCLHFTYDYWFFIWIFESTMTTWPVVLLYQKLYWYVINIYFQLTCKHWIFESTTTSLTSNSPLSKIIFGCIQCLFSIMTYKQWLEQYQRTSTCQYGRNLHSDLSYLITYIVRKIYIRFIWKIISLMTKL